MSFADDHPSRDRSLTPAQPVSKQSEEFLTPKQAAAFLRVSKSYLDKLRVYGGGPKFLRFGRKILYRRSELDLWAEQRSFSSTSEYRDLQSNGRNRNTTDAIAAIEKADELSPAQKRHWSTSLRQMGRYFDRPLALIPTCIAAIGAVVRELHPARLGVNSKTFANHRANARAALLWFNKRMPDSGRKAPMDPCYRSLLQQVEDRYARDMLSPFFRFLSSQGIRLHDVRDSHVEAFQAYRRDTSFGKVKRSQHRALVRHWNAYAVRIAGWPKIELTEPSYAKRFIGPAWDDFPEGLRNDIDSYCERIGKRHRTTSGKIARPCKASTINMRRRELVAALRAAVEAGIPLGELGSLRNLLRPDRVEIIIEHYWQKNGEKPSLYTIDLASKLLALARRDAFSEGELAQLDEIRLSLEQYRSSGLTDKNRRLICGGRSCGFPKS
jgi:excisionase family DNA binding protein